MPRAGLTPERVVAEAAAVADDLGHDGLTLAAVADRFGVAVPSLYKHVGGIEDLRSRLTTRAVRELGDHLAPAASAPSRTDALTQLAAAYRNFARTHPGRYAATVRAPDPDDRDHLAAADAVLHLVLEVLRRYGLSGDDAIDAARSVRAALHGFVALETAGGFGLPQDVDRSFHRLVTALDGALADWPTDDADS